MNIISRVIEKLFRLEPIEPKGCDSCEVLRLELSIAHRDNERLLDKLLNPNLNTPENKPDDKEMIPVRTSRNFLPSKVRQHFTEEADRRTLQLMQDTHKRIKEAGINPTTLDTSIKTLEEEVLGLAISDKEFDETLAQAEKERNNNASQIS